MKNGSGIKNEVEAKECLFHFADKIMQVTWNLLFILLVVSIGSCFFDLSEREYFTDWLADFFNYDTSGVITIATVVWAFVVSLFSIVMGQLQSRRLGIRTIDIILCEYSVLRFLSIPGIVVFEILWLWLAVVTEWKITLIMTTICIFISALYIVLFSAIKTSQRNAIKMIGEQLQEIIFNNEEEMERARGLTEIRQKLNDILDNTIFNALWGKKSIVSDDDLDLLIHILNQIDIEENESELLKEKKNQYYRELCYLCIEKIEIDLWEQKGYLEKVLQQLYDKEDGKGESAMKKALLMSLIEHLGKEDGREHRWCKNLLNFLLETDRNMYNQYFQEWAFSYCLYLMDCNEVAYKRYESLLNDLKSRYHLMYSKNFRMHVVRYGNQIDDKGISSSMISKFIPEMEE